MGSNKNGGSPIIGCGGTFIIILVIYAIFSSTTNRTKDDEDYLKDTDYSTSYESTTESSTQTTIEAKETFKDIMYSYLDKDVADKLCGIITDMGYSDSEIEFDSKADGSDLYKVYFDGQETFITASDDVYRIWGSSYVFYEDGEIKCDKAYADAKKISWSDQNKYEIMADNIVKDSLKNKSGAKVTCLGVDRYKDMVIVVGQVTAKNDFNAKVTEDFIVEYIVNDLANFQCAPIYIQIGDNKSGEYVELD